MNNTGPNKSRLCGFYKLTAKERRQALQNLCPDFSKEDEKFLLQALPMELADKLSENVIGTYALPFSVATNFVVNGQGVLVPMATEEPSIVAAASKMAKLVASCGGFKSLAQPSIMKGQVQLFGFLDIDKAIEILVSKSDELVCELNQQIPKMLARGGGVIDLAFRQMNSRYVQGAVLLVEARINVADAMGANLVNTLMESLGAKLKNLLNAKVNLRILSNLCDDRLAQASCAIPYRLLDEKNQGDFGEEIAIKMALAHELAEQDPYRACTHNKGIMNGIDALALATGNDFRAVEAGAHAFAAKSGRYGPLSVIELDQKAKILHASIKLPVAVGVVGGIVKHHPGLKCAHKILGDFAKSAQALASLMASVGLNQCLAAIFALCQEGIQKGHLKLHHKKKS